MSFTRQCERCNGTFETRHATQQFCSKKCFQERQPPPQRPIAERFWEKVERRGAEECWPWKAYIAASGYGICRGATKNVRAHRMAYELAHGPIPEGLIVRHRCDNRRCCNPRHLEVGTATDNARDRVERRRTAHGERSPAAKLSEAQVVEIRRRYKLRPPGGPKRGCPKWPGQEQLAKEYGVSYLTIHAIVHGYSWKHVPMSSEVLPALQNRPSCSPNPAPVPELNKSTSQPPPA